MFELKETQNRSNFILFLCAIFSFYILIPYISIFFDNHFEKNILSNFPVISHNNERNYIYWYR